MAAPGSSTQPRVDLAALTAERELPLGQLIPGSRYRVISRIGRGGMGAVYEAEHVDLQKRVAIKVLLSKTEQDNKRVAAFLREARTASRIASPYIADVTDFGQLPDGRVYFVMAYIEGSSLGRLLRAGERFAPARAIPILRQIAKALAATHDKGVVHLDVKPDNIMLVAEGRRRDAVKMVDFGIAGLLDESRPGARTISGTPEYVSPERIAALGYDLRSDVYSLGVVAYEVLTGVPPFRHANAVETLKMHMEAPPPPMAQVAPDRPVPARLEKVVQQLLEKDPEARPPSMAVVEALLCEAQVAAGIATAWDDLELPPVDEEWRRTLAERMPSPGARKRRVLALVSSSLALVAVGLAIFFGVIRDTKVVIKEVRVEVTRTVEAAEVAAWVIRAEHAIRRQQYVEPEGDSALSHIEQAEREARALGVVSGGARSLRSTAAAALMALGQELEQLDLFELAIVKYREALRFLPADPELQVKAGLQPGELEVFMDRAQWAVRQQASPSGRRGEEARQRAADVFAAARNGQTSRARVLLRELAQLDADGSQRARLADGLRRVANGHWDRGKIAEAAPLYQVIAELDPADARAASRALADTRPAQPASAAALVPAEEALVVPVSARPGPARPAARDAEAARKLVGEGQAAVAAASFDAAEQAFRAAIAADPGNGAAFHGLAEVAFERARYEEAVELARQAVRRTPRSARLHRLLGDAYFKLFRHGEAAAAYRTAQSLDPRDPEIARRLQQVQGK